MSGFDTASPSELQEAVFIHRKSFLLHNYGEAWLDKSSRWIASGSIERLQLAHSGPIKLNPIQKDLGWPFKTDLGRKM